MNRVNGLASFALGLLLLSYHHSRPARTQISEGDLLTGSL